MKRPCSLRMLHTAALRATSALVASCLLVGGVAGQASAVELARLPEVAAGAESRPAAPRSVPADPLGTIVAPENLPVPPLPPAPGVEEVQPLPTLEDELWHHGGSYLYAPEGDHLGWPPPCSDEHYDVLRLPEWWQAPEPFTMFAQFEGVGPIRTYPRLHWPGGYAWEPRLVGYGGYRLFGLAQESGGVDTVLVGHQLLLDLDFRLTGTERFHVEYRPIGEGGTGGSYYRFTDPDGYVSNATGVPDRYWFEAEFASLFGDWLSPFAVRDYHMTVGKFPFALQNNLLINDEILGVIVGKNTIPLGTASNVNLQLVYGFNDIDAYTAPADATMYGANSQIDWRDARFDLSYFYVQHSYDSSRDRHYAALSASQLRGPWNYGVRTLFKFGDEGGTGPGQLFVFEWNRVRAYHENCLGVESSVTYATAFGATQGWQPISGGNFDRLRSSFEVNPLVAISAGLQQGQTYGFALGTQYFRHHQDESFVPEIAFEAPEGDPVWGLGLRYYRKTSARSFFEVLGVVNFSDNPKYERQGIYLSESIFF